MERLQATASILQENILPINYRKLSEKRKKIETNGKKNNDTPRKNLKHCLPPVFISF